MRNRRMTGGVTEAIVRRHRPVYQIVLYMGLLLLLGLVVMYALGPQRASVLARWRLLAGNQEIWSLAWNEIGR